ncbi:hypothetical protein [Lihuaxuella thermophila]|uniref:Uncharacterized protein n=1 Tax=Lihuaxuella thermophila TaxID=1173111 RepID=A0A1H8C7Q1_9BACL|nr:hypothetical protein [Lihuaxuella thermophila]SEM91095.1 hypothetical protein SAMN05444955_103125 [Lihuaxuella thermophila]
MKNLGKFLALLSLLLPLSAAIYEPVYAANKTALTGTVHTTIEFDKENAAPAKKWFDDVVAMAKEDLEAKLEKAPKEEQKKIKKQLNELKKIHSKKLFKDHPDGSADLKVPLPQVEIQVGDQKTRANHKGKYTLPHVPLGKHKVIISENGKKLREFEVVVERGHPRMDIDLQIYDKQWFVNSNRMSAAMKSHSHASHDHVTTQDVATYPQLPYNTFVGTGKGEDGADVLNDGTMRIVSDPSKGEPKNIVSCNKASAYESPDGKKPFDPNATENWLSNTWMFPANDSDCTRSIGLGFIYDASLGLIDSYKMSHYCVLESINSAMDALDSYQNIYCDGMQKSDGHWNCSWFNGIGHTEELHTH